MKKSSIALFILLPLIAALSLFAAAPNSQAHQATIPPGTTAAVYLPLVGKSASAPVATLTPTAVEATATPTATPTPLLAVSIKSTNAISRSGSLYVVGEVFNTGNIAAYSITVQVKVFDVSNQLLATVDGSTVLPRVSPGRVNPFRLVLVNPPSGIVKYQVNITFQSNSTRNYSDITVLSQQVRDNTGVEVFGELRNDTEALVHPPTVAVTFYGASGNVVDVDYVSAASELATGQTASYSIQTLRQIIYNSYMVQAQSY